MNSITQKLSRYFLLLLCCAMFSACGQKGPLELEQPREKTQTEESEQTK